MRVIETKSENKFLFEELRKLAVPILEAVHSWLTEQYKQVIPKSAIGIVNSSLWQWKKLSPQATHVGLEIENNLKGMHN